jgi:hypothetical protein
MAAESGLSTFGASHIRAFADWRDFADASEWQIIPIRQRDVR